MAGDIAAALQVPPATLSFHLKELAQAGLVESESQGRNVCYRANFDAMNGLIEYLTYNCCAGSPSERCEASEARAGAEMKRDPKIRPGVHQDMPAVRQLLQQAQLPVADLESSAITFLVAELDNTMRGVVGLQVFGTSALLRSLVISDDERSTGLGHALLVAAEEVACRMQVRELVLLTTLAGPWFARHGYLECDRDKVAEQIRSSAEFTHLCPASAFCMYKLLPDHGNPMKRNVLFLCTGNSARSVLAEASLRAWGNDRYRAFSAGSQPTGHVNPFALSQLQAEGMPIEGLRSKSWDEFVDGPALDLVITVCDSAAAEACPVIFGDFIRCHWGLPDPAAVEGSAAEKAIAFSDAHAIVKVRIQALLDLPEAVWTNRETLQQALDHIGDLVPAQVLP